MNITFAEQASKYIEQSAVGRNPLAPGTLRAYKSYLGARLLPGLGSKRLQDINEVVLKQFFDQICPELKPETLSRIRKVFKAVMDSAVDENGRKIYAQEWNWGFVDLPAISQADKNTPEIGPERLSQAILAGSAKDRLLWAFLAGSGLRISEAFAVSTTPEVPGNVWSPADKTVQVRYQRLKDGSLTAPKTPSSVRIVDLCSELNDFMLRTAKISNTAMLFEPDYKEHLRRLQKVEPDIAFHAFRRFRITQLVLAGVPDALDRFWSGHASSDVHQRYAKVGNLIEERRQWAEKVGLGFELPS